MVLCYNSRRSLIQSMWKVCACVCVWRGEAWEESCFCACCSASPSFCLTTSVCPLGFSFRGLCCQKSDYSSFPQWIWAFPLEAPWNPGYIVENYPFDVITICIHVPPPLYTVSSLKTRTTLFSCA